ncbi:MAG: AMP-binding protein [Pseudomonadales bacterium]
MDLQKTVPWETIPEMLEDVFSRYAELDVIVDGDVRLSYQQLGELVRKCAGAMLHTGLKNGDRVAIWAANSWRWEVSALACWWLGLVVVPISPRLKNLEALPILEEVSPKLIFLGSESLQAPVVNDLAGSEKKDQKSLSDYLPGCLEIVVLTGAPSSGIRSWDKYISGHHIEEARYPAKISGEDICQIIFTSGTTGKPKGVMMGGGQNLRSFFNKPAAQEYKKGDRFLLTTPFSHIVGLYSGMLNSLMRGMAQIFAGDNMGQKLADLILREKVAVMTGPPSLFAQLLVEKVEGVSVLAGVRNISTGAAYIPQQLIEDLRGVGVEGVYTGYGLTECSVVTGTGPDDSLEDIASTVGKPLDGVFLKLLDNGGEPVTNGTVGEIWVSGYGVMQGYFENQEATSNVIDDEGWLNTGDLGRLLESGFLQIVGRKKEMYISHGFNVYPAEVEGLLLKSEFLKAVAVVGKENRLSGEEGIAFIVPKDLNNFDLSILRNWARKNLANYKVPTKFIVQDSLPLNANGKVDKLQLKKSLSSEAPLPIG